MRQEIRLPVPLGDALTRVALAKTLTALSAPRKTQTKLDLLDAPFYLYLSIAGSGVVDKVISGRDATRIKTYKFYTPPSTTGQRR